jgi:hypothetical protein
MALWEEAADRCPGEEKAVHNRLRKHRPDLFKDAPENED